MIYTVIKMTTQTIARMFQVATGTLLGEYGNTAIYHLGTALALSVLENTVNEDEHGFDRPLNIEYHVRMAKMEFLNAKQNNQLRNYNQPPVRPDHFGLISSECEGAYLQCE